MIKRFFLDHPRAVEERYFEHMWVALSFSGAMAKGAIACFVHAVIPGLCVTTGSRTVQVLHDRMVLNRRRESKSGTGEAVPLQSGG